MQIMLNRLPPGKKSLLLGSFAGRVRDVPPRIYIPLKSSFQPFTQVAGERNPGGIGPTMILALRFELPPGLLH